MRTTEENNRLIAEFMGYKLVDKEWDLYETPECMYDIRDTSGDLNMKPAGSEMCFHSSWDWLMPVVEKIRINELVENFNINITCDAIIEGLNGLDIHVYAGQYDTTLMVTYQAVIQFIEWYNEQKERS